ncbi:MAG: hypothetical protein FWG20_03105 [Candidatus Cloacimonetes bacterium]|nr:hypothetical protein [Candidatus Cloacimonadota bacterium]
MKTESDRKKIREFLDLLDNEKYNLTRYSKPVLVYLVDENKRVKYSIWEEDMLNRFGVENVDGWDYEDDLSFCPDWVADDEDDDDWDDDDDDEDF